MVVSRHKVITVMMYRVGAVLVHVVITVVRHGVIIALRGEVDVVLRHVTIAMSYIECVIILASQRKTSVEVH